MKKIEVVEKNLIILNRYKETLKKNKEELISNNAPKENIKKIDKEIETIDNLMKDIQDDLNEKISEYKEQRESTKSEQKKEKNNIDDNLLKSSFCKFIGLNTDEKRGELERQVIINDNNNQDIDFKDIEEKNIYNGINLGSKIKIIVNSKVYKNAKDSILEKNQYTSKYDNLEEERVILGVSISQNDTIHNVFACTENAKEKIEDLLKNGGTIESVLTGNSSRIKKLKNYNGDSILTATEINKMAEGWYNINSVAFDSKKRLTL